MWQGLARSDTGVGYEGWAGFQGLEGVCESRVSQVIRQCRPQRAWRLQNCNRWREPRGTLADEGDVRDWQEGYGVGK